MMTEHTDPKNHKKVWGSGFHAGLKAAKTSKSDDEDTRNAKNTMLCWNPGTDDVKLISWPDEKDYSKNYLMSCLACYTETHDLTFEQRKALVFIEAIHLIIRDGCDKYAVHNALMGLEEYKDGLDSGMLRKY